MAVVVSIMDRPGWGQRTDNIVVANACTKRLIWVPRDLWCDRIRNRINVAYKLGGHFALMTVLKDFQVHANTSICLQRDAIRSVLEGHTVTVPVDAPVWYYYPMAPELNLEDGNKTISFEPPFEVLEGERIHQWLGARKLNMKHKQPPAVLNDFSDFQRIRRQMTIVRIMLQEGFDFMRFIAKPQWYSISTSAALEELACIKADWHFEIAPLAYKGISRYGMSVLAATKPYMP